MKTLLPLLTFLLLLAAPARAQPAVPGCIEIASVPYTISAPGTYCLNRSFDVDITSGATITINSIEVNLDCREHTLYNFATALDGSSSAIYLLNRHDVTIRNCRILGGYTHGIHVAQDNSVANRNYAITIADNVVTECAWHGIRAFGTDIEVRDNRVYNVGGQANASAIGIRVGGATPGNKFHVVTGNVVSNTVSLASNAFAIYSDNSVAGVFTGNRVSRTFAANGAYRSYGIRIASGSDNLVTGNSLVGRNVANDTGIYATATDACYDNHIRSPQPTRTCDDSLGNH
jgi:hypothetical protein